MTRITDKGEAARLAAELHALERLDVLRPEGGAWARAASDGRVAEARRAVLGFMDALSLLAAPHRPGGTGVMVNGVAVSDTELYDLLDGVMRPLDGMVEARRAALDALREEGRHGEGA